MAGLFLKNEQREHLKILREKSSEAVVDLCKLALEYLNSGSNEKKYAAASKKLNIPTDLIQPTVEALVCLLIDATRSNITESEFELLKGSGFSHDHISILWQFVSSKRNFVENILKKTNTKDYKFRDLDWRLEAKIASRSLLFQSTPAIVLKFHLDAETVPENRTTIRGANSISEVHQSENRKEVVVQTDPNNLVHLIDILEQALVEAKTHRSRNLLKVLQ